MTRALRNGRGRTAVANAYAHEAARAELTVININQEITELRATLFRLDPTPERLTAWADAYGTLPESDAL